MIMNYVLCGLGMWMLMGVLFHAYNDTCKNWVANLCGGIIVLPWSIIYNVLLYIILYPIACIWLFFRNAIKGVSEQAWENAKITHFWKLGCFRFCYDPDARKLTNKLFLVRIVKPAEKVNHDSAKK
jgi:hypothetical protein